MTQKPWFKVIKKKSARTVKKLGLTPALSPDPSAGRAGRQTAGSSTPTPAANATADSEQSGADALTLPADALEKMKTALVAITVDLKQFADGSENDFMQLGLGLRDVHANVAELTDLMLGAVEQFGTNEKGGLLERGRQTLNAALADIQSRQKEVKSDLERINSVMRSIESLYETSKQIKQFAKSLKIVALSMLIENARTIDASVNIFADVAEEIKDLSVSISDIANDIYTNVERAREVHRITREKISFGISQLEALTEEIQATVRVSTRETKKLMQLSIDTVAQEGKRSRKISRKVAEVVVGVQFHDNMKQRIMYINAIFEAMINSAQCVPGAEGGAKVKDKAVADIIIREQAARLNEIDIEVHGVYQKNQRAITAINEQVNDLLQQLQKMASDNLADGRALIRDPFSHLRGALAQLHTLMDQGKSLYGQIQDAAVHVSQIAGNLSELLVVVRSISANTHNKSINSIIAADRQGERGGALKLLAQEMNLLATRSDGFSNEVDGIVTAIMNSTIAIKSNAPEGGADTGGDESAIDRLGQIMDDITRRYDQFQKDARTAYQRAQTLKQATDTILSGLDFFIELSRTLSGYSEQLTLVADQPGLDMIGVDIAAAATHHVPGKHTADRDDNVILFEDAQKTRQETADPESLGDNIELF